MATQTTSEKRKIFRVRLTGALLDAKLDGVPHCALVDGNSEGFAVVSETRFRLGQIVKVELRYEGKTYCGRACVRNARKFALRRSRYGLEVCAKQQELREGLRKIAIAVQRTLLRRSSQRAADGTEPAPSDKSSPPESSAE